MFLEYAGNATWITVTTLAKHDAFTGKCLFILSESSGIVPRFTVEFGFSEGVEVAQVF